MRRKEVAREREKVGEKRGINRRDMREKETTQGWRGHSGEERERDK